MRNTEIFPFKLMGFFCFFKFGETDFIHKMFLFQRALRKQLRSFEWSPELNPVLI